MYLSYYLVLREFVFERHGISGNSKVGKKEFERAIPLLRHWKLRKAEKEPAESWKFIDPLEQGEVDYEFFADYWLREVLASKSKDEAVIKEGEAVKLKRAASTRSLEALERKGSTRSFRALSVERQASGNTFDTHYYSMGTLDLDLQPGDLRRDSTDYLGPRERPGTADSHVSRGGSARSLSSDRPNSAGSSRSGSPTRRSRREGTVTIRNSMKLVANENPSGDLNWNEKLAGILPTGKDPVSQATRKEWFREFDKNGNCILSLAEVDAGLKIRLNHCGIEMFTPAINRAFYAARAIAPPVASFSNDYIDWNEFRFLLIYVKHYIQIWVVFNRIDTSNDRRISMEEFKRGWQELVNEKIVPSHFDPEKAFGKIDANGGEQILFDEFADGWLRNGIDLDEEPEERKEALRLLLAARPNLSEANIPHGRSHSKPHRHRLPASRHSRVGRSIPETNMEFASPKGKFKHDPKKLSPEVVSALRSRASHFCRFCRTGGLSTECFGRYCHGGVYHGLYNGRPSDFDVPGPGFYADSLPTCFHGPCARKDVSQAVHSAFGATKQKEEIYDSAFDTAKKNTYDGGFEADLSPEVIPLSEGRHSARSLSPISKLALRGSGRRKTPLSRPASGSRTANSQFSRFPPQSSSVDLQRLPQQQTGIQAPFGVQTLLVAPAQSTTLRDGIRSGDVGLPSARRSVHFQDSSEFTTMQDIRQSSSEFPTILMGTLDPGTLSHTLPPPAELPT